MKEEKFDLIKDDIHNLCLTTDYGLADKKEFEFFEKELNDTYMIYSNCCFALNKLDELISRPEANLGLNIWYAHYLIINCKTRIKNIINNLLLGELSNFNDDEQIRDKKYEYIVSARDIWDERFTGLEICFMHLVEKINPNFNLKEAMEKVLHITEKIDRQTEHPQIIPKYEMALIDGGLIDENRNAIGSAPEIAEFLVDKMGMDDLKPEIIQRYKYNGEPFKEGTARKAVTMAKTQ